MGAVISTSKTILITGAGSGIGKETALRLQSRGHHVIATTHHEKQSQELQALSIESFVLDITKQKDREKVRNLDIDVLINCAGMGETGSLAEVAIDKIKDNFEVNVFSTFAITQEVLKRMVPKKQGTIVFISSLLGRTTSPFFGPYSMSKHAVSSGAKMLSQELHLLSKDLHVALVEPGAYHTGFNQKMMEKKFVWMGEHSYFSHLKAKLKRDEERRFHLVEVASVAGIVDVIIKVVESDHPHFRSSAPWWQSLFTLLS
ncbi:MAG: SDR family NAD(P)-dependent oxidoreductase [Candidatus Woesebacteria bacterium]